MHAWVLAHTYRLLRDWREARLSEWFRANPEYTRKFGFTSGDDGLGQFTADAPSQSRLWEIWNTVFTSVERDLCQKVAEKLLVELRRHNLPLPRGPTTNDDS